MSSFMKADRTKKYWENSAEAWEDFICSGLDYYRDYMNNPATFRTLGFIKRKKVLDLACGEGYNSRLMAKKGARVTAIDFSEKMIRIAKSKEDENKLGIKYYVMNASNLERLKRDYFNIVVCFMGMQDIKNYKRAVKQVYRVLEANGRFVFTIPHPCFEWESKKRSRDSARNMLGNYYRNFEKRRYIINWNMKRLNRTFRTVSFHRSLTDYSHALNEAGFFIKRLEEARPTLKGAKRYRVLREHFKVPQSIIFETIKIRH